MTRITFLLRLIIYSSLLLASGASWGQAQLSQGVRVLMFDGTAVDRKNRENVPAFSFFVPRQLEVLDAAYTSEKEQGLFLSQPEEVLKFFSGLPSGVQQKGLWVTYVGESATILPDVDKFTALRNGATSKNVLMFFCHIEAAKAARAVYVAWACNQVSPTASGQTLICEPETLSSPTGSPLWSCAK